MTRLPVSAEPSVYLVELLFSESRIMKTADGFQQCYNAQVAVTVGTQLRSEERRVGKECRL